jgi:AAA domain-containing protein/primase-like protein
MSAVDATTSAPAPPKFIQPDFERMPPELRLLKNWILWAAVWNGTKWTKRPIQISGYGASTTNAKHWSSFDHVKQAYGCAVQRGYMELREKGKPVQQVPVGGVGFVFDGQPEADGLVFAGVDFDKVISGREITSLAEERIRRLGSYTERSVSGGGYHVIVKARPLAGGIAHGGVEMYTSGRYFTMTGRAPENARIVAAPDPFAALADEVQALAGNRPAHGPDTASENGQQGNFTSADRERLRKLFGDPDGSLSDGLETNLKEIRSAVSAIPPSAISAEADWMRFARALAREAAVYKKQSEELWEILDSASRVAPGYNEPENRTRWLRLISEAFARENPITIATVFDLAKKYGWQGWPPADAAASASGATQANAQQASSHRAIPISSLPLIPPKRPWVHGTDLMRGAVSLLVAPGARAKTTWLLTCALACASGRSLLGAHVYGGPKRVLYLSAEDSTNEIALRLRAAMQHHGLRNSDVAGLNVIGAESWGLALLGASRGAPPAIDQTGWGALNAELDRLEPDVLFLDPLINLMGGVDSNDNSAAALLMGQLVALAARRGIAIMIAHHAAKGRNPTSAESAMGAASFVNLSRIALGIEPLDEKDAGKLGLPPWEASSTFRVLGTKQNFSPPNAKDRWFRILPVEIQNQQPPVYVNGDKVAVIEIFQPGASGPVFPPQLIHDALVAIDRANPPLSSSKNAKERYSAPVIAEAVAQHRGGRKSDDEGKAILDHLVASGLVQVQPVKVVRPGSRTDDRKGLVLTPAGKAVIQQTNQGMSNSPRSPQCPAESTAGTAENAGGDPLAGPPHC